MPIRELSKPQQITEWIHEWGGLLKAPGCMTLIQGLIRAMPLFD
jgi:hypothetical protein